MYQRSVGQGTQTEMVDGGHKRRINHLKVSKTKKGAPTITEL